MKQHPHDFILTIACPDAKGIVFKVSEFLFQRQCNILDSAQFGDDETGLFFLRIHFEHAGEQTQAEIEAAFTPLASQLQMTWRLHSAKRRSRVLVMVSRSRDPGCPSQNALSLPACRSDQ